MKAAQLTGPRRFEFVETDDPVPADGQVLLKIEHASVCGSDTHLQYGAALPEERYPLAPGAPCHEIAGTIVESRNPKYPAGMRAIVLPDFSPAGHASGGLAEYIASSSVIPIPDTGGTDEWVMCQPSGTALYAARRWESPDTKRIAVLGQGSIGLSCTMIAAAQGVRQVIGLDLEDYRLEKARELGADGVINPDRENTVEALADLTGGRGVDVVVDASGDPDGLNTCVELVKDRGLIISVSLIPFTQRMDFNYMGFIRKELRIHASGAAGAENPTEFIEDMVSLRERGWVDPARLITHRVGWAGIPDAYEMYDTRADGIIKVVIAVNE